MPIPIMPDTKAGVSSLRQFSNDNGGERIDIIAKIENQAGVDNIEEIGEACEGIMISRRDTPPSNKNRIKTQRNG